MRSACLLFSLLVLNVMTIKASHADQAILIGGGYNVNGSQGQIELNVKWVQRVLKNSGLPVTTFFTDGQDPAPDVHYQHLGSQDAESTAIDELAKQLEPVARLFGDQYANQRRYRNHSVDDVKAGTSANTLAQALEDILAANPDEPSLIVFNGHGNQSSTTADKVTMELWNDTQISAADMQQCYSGGFHRVAYANAEQGLQLSETTRCGFTAESAYRLAEGCSSSVNTEDYRDYTTYFFAALDGYDRNGNVLPVETDTNDDGHVSLREAHFYTLENAHSTDLSRSTSEDYLITWQPWYLKWIAEKPALQNNEYAKLFRVLADRHNISLAGNPAKVIRNNMHTYSNIGNGLLERQIEVQSAIAKNQHELIYTAQARWPAIANPYTATFQSMLTSGEIMEIANWLTEQPGYQTLIELQNNEQAIRQAQLDNERNLTQMQKMLHFRNVAKLKRQLYVYGTPEQISDYEKLVDCEDKPLEYVQ